VDVTARVSSGTDGVLLFDYTSLSGAFGVTNVVHDAGALVPGAKGSLSMGQFAIDYADSDVGDGTAIVLYYHNQLPQGTVVTVK
jgi:hypothetical protein